MPNNMPKNRYINILPYNHTRVPVRLHPHDDANNSYEHQLKYSSVMPGYINASFVDVRLYSLLVKMLIVGLGIQQ